MKIRSTLILALAVSWCGLTIAEDANPPAKKPGFLNRLFKQKKKAPAPSAEKSVPKYTAGDINYTLREAHNGCTVTLGVGQTVMTSLNENRTTGFSWRTVRAPDQAIVLPAAASPDPDYRSPPSDRDGAAGPDHRLAFKAVAPGTTTIELVYRQPWDGGAIGSKFNYTIKVTSDLPKATQQATPSQPPPADVPEEPTEAQEINLAPTDDLQAAVQKAVPRTTLVLQAGEYQVPEMGLVIEDKKDIHLKGNGAVSLINPSMDNLVVRVANSQFVELTGLHLTHKPAVKDGRCTAGVLSVEGSRGIRLHDCHLDGCGAYALSATESRSIYLNGGKATHNSGGVFYLFGCENVTISQMAIQDNYEANEAEPLPILVAGGSQRLNFTDNRITGNKNRQFSALDGCFIVDIGRNEFADNAFGSPTDPVSEAPTKVLKEATSRETVKLSVGQVLEVALPNNPSTGFSWSFSAFPNAAVVGPVALPPALSLRPLKNLPPGAPGADFRIGFKAIAPGTTSVELVSSRPWEDDKSQGTKAKFTIEVIPAP
ncbi:MAG: protease inhibitor I42 family protein [Verrucomicrobiaceae bacterium]|nr:protease inhibitor I42 family protein [Verrucomicrobiaceae bacterium]